MWDILSTYAEDNVFVTIIPEAEAIPADLVLLHEHGDNYSLQTSGPCTPDELNSRLSTFLADKKQISAEEFFEQFPLV